ncbi:MAG TPA: hypothetical protein VK912_18905 [Longimicrobiales bacterium]|nr:hypothetical protein [Longimicrobiales bacterium]
MSHVDEGTLHAILDGALEALSDAGELPGGVTSADVMEHLRTCADCRARLEAERSIRASAGMVLHDARLPDVDVPPFAGVPVADRARRGRWMPLGWAASILLAVGAGWWGSAAWRAPGPSFDGVAQEAGSLAQPETEQASREPMEAIDDGRDARMNSARTDATDAGAERSEAALATGDTRDAVDRQTVSAAASAESRTARVDPVTGSAAEARTAAADAPAGAAAGEAGQATRRAELAADPVPAPAPPPALSLAAPRRLAGVDSITGRVPVAEATPAATSAADAMLRAPAGSAFSFRPGETFVLSDSIFAAPSASALKQMAAAVNARPAAFDTTLAREQSGRMAFTAASATDRRRIEHQVYNVEDASPPSIALARDGDETTVRLRQTLQSGKRVELITWRSEPAAAMEVAAVTPDAATNTASPRREARSRAAAAPEQTAAPAAQTADAATERVELTTLPAVRRLRDGRNEIVLRDVSSSVWIALRADLAAEELRDLATRLRRLPPQ